MPDDGLKWAIAKSFFPERGAMATVSELILSQSALVPKLLQSVRLRRNKER